jgi:hypothetical protein
MKFFAPALLSLALSSSAFASVGEFGTQLQSASERIRSILTVAGVEDMGDEDGPTPAPQPTPWEVNPVDPNGGAWKFEDDRKAVPLYDKSANILGEAGISFIQAQTLENSGQFELATLRKTQACARVNIALADLALANHYASLPGFSMRLKAFGPELTELLSSIRQNRTGYCSF